VDSSAVVLFIAFAGLVSAIGFCRSYYSSEARARRALQGLRRTAMRDARDGERCRVVGRLEYTDSTLEAPFTARECAGYSVRVKNDDSGGGEVLREDRCRDFFLRDENGTCALIRGTSAQIQIVLTKDASFRSLAPLTLIWPKLEEPPPRVEAFMKERGHSIKGRFFSKTIRFDEGVLEKGELVSVSGVARWEATPDPHASGGAYREMPKLLTLSSAPGEPLVISDEPDTTSG
jgi:hypothetical protein